MVLNLFPKNMRTAVEDFQIYDGCFSYPVSVGFSLLGPLPAVGFTVSSLNEVSLDDVTPP
ncbi:hypothetical protein OROHE_019833 [Orobanche hederae]